VNSSHWPAGVLLAVSRSIAISAARVLYFV
jgi:hypothetical protein